MNVKKCLILFNVLLMLASPASASYAGDHPLKTVVHAEHEGTLKFSLGDSRYSGELAPGDNYTVNFNLDPPKGGSVKFAKVYVYWVWSKNGLEGIYPRINATLTHEKAAVLNKSLLNTSMSNTSVLNKSLPDTSELSTPVPLLRKERYTDTKGFVSRYDFFSGTDAFDPKERISGEGPYSVTVTNVAEDGSDFCVQGIGLLLAYEVPGMAPIEYWINEGCDMLYADYGIEPETATSTTYFEGDIDLEKISSARLITVVPSGGYTSGTEARSKLFFNEKTKQIPVLGDIIKLLFGGGKSWKNVYLTNETVQIALDDRAVSDYLTASGNYASIQDNGDYLLATNAVLVLRSEKPEEK